MGFFANSHILIFIWIAFNPCISFSSDSLGYKSKIERNDEKKAKDSQEVLSNNPDDVLIGPTLPSKSYLEETRKTLSTRVLRLADTVDTLFGEKRVDDQKNWSTLRLSQRIVLKNGSSGFENPTMTLNLHLPNVQKIERSIQDWLKQSVEKAGEVAGISGDSNGVSQVSEENLWTVHSESGIILANPLNYFARLRLRRDFIFEKFVHSFYEQIGWSKIGLWEEETSLTSDYAISRDLLFRFVNVKSWAISNDILSSAHGPSLIQQLSDNEAVSYDLRFFTLEENHRLYGEKLAVGSTFRTRLPMRWIFIDVNPEIAWERTTNFITQYNLFFRLELVFGNLKDN